LPFLLLVKWYGGCEGKVLNSGCDYDCSLSKVLNRVLSDDGAMRPFILQRIVTKCNFLYYIELWANAVGEA
jgi:hypothetical protein